VQRQSTILFCECSYDPTGAARLSYSYARFCLESISRNGFGCGRLKSWGCILCISSLPELDFEIGAREPRVPWHVSVHMCEHFGTSFTSCPRGLSISPCALRCCVPTCWPGRPRNHLLFAYPPLFAILVRFWQPSVLEPSNSILGVFEVRRTTSLMVPIGPHMGAPSLRTKHVATTKSAESAMEGES